MTSVEARPWEGDLATLLAELSSVQSELLQILTEKREVLLKPDAIAMSELQRREADVLVRLEQCQQRRAQLLEQSAQSGPPARTLRALASTLPRGRREPLAKKLKAASAQSRLLQHHSLTNWVVAQRTLLHLSQLLEIIATGGRIKPTYGNGDTAGNSGSLVDQAA